MKKGNCDMKILELVLEKIPESPLDCKEIQLVRPKGNQSWLSIWRTDVEAETAILWPPDTKSGLIWKDPDAGRDWGQEEKGTTEDETVGWHHWLNGYGFGWILAWCAAVHGVAKSWTRLSDWTELTNVRTPSAMYSYCVWQGNNTGNKKE